MAEVAIGSKWLSNRGVYGVVEQINGVKRMCIKMNGRTMKTLTIQKLKKDEWTEL